MESILKKPVTDYSQIAESSEVRLVQTLYIIISISISRYSYIYMDKATDDLESILKKPVTDYSQIAESSEVRGRAHFCIHLWLTRA